MKNYDHNTGIFVGHDGLQLFFQSWEVAEVEQIIIISHGLGEHSGRYHNLLKSFSGKNISFYGADHRGHGQSAGIRGHVNSINDYLLDLNIFINLIKNRIGQPIPFILLGHSMGGLIAIKYVLDYPESLSRLILSSPGLIPAIKVPKWKEFLGNKVSKILPSLSLANNIEADCLSHDLVEVQNYKNDPLVHNKVSARWFTEFTKASQECLARAKEIKIPFFIFHGKNDKIVDFKGSKQFYEQVSSLDKEIYLFDNLYHETMNETEKERVFEKVVKFVLEK